MSAISSQHHSFDISIASKYGVECAILIHHFQHWIRINRFAKRNIREGRCWSYQSRREIQAHFPYWSFDEIRRLCEKLIEVGVLITNNFNKSKVDKTLWYAFVNEKEFGVDEEFSNKVYERQNCLSRGKSASPEGKSATPIPDTKSKDKERERERKGASPPASPPPPLAPIFSHKRVKMEESKFHELRNEFGHDKVQEMLDRLDEYADLNPKRFRQYACHATVVRKWIREDSEKAKEKLNPKVINKLWSQRLKDKFSDRNDIYIGDEGITFSGGVAQINIRYEEFGFKEQVISRLRKMGIPIEVL